MIVKDMPDFRTLQLTNKTLIILMDFIITGDDTLTYEFEMQASHRNMGNNLVTNCFWSDRRLISTKSIKNRIDQSLYSLDFALYDCFLYYNQNDRQGQIDSSRTMT